MDSSVSALAAPKAGSYRFLNTGVGIYARPYLFKAYSGAITPDSFGVIPLDAKIESNANHALVRTIGNVDSITGAVARSGSYQENLPYYGPRASDPYTGPARVVKISQRATALFYEDTLAAQFFITGYTTGFSVFSDFLDSSRNVLYRNGLRLYADGTVESVSRFIEDYNILYNDFYGHSLGADSANILAQRHGGSGILLADLPTEREEIDVPPWRSSR